MSSFPLRSAHHGPALAAPDVEVEPVVDHARPVALVDTLEYRDVVARARRRLKVELNDPTLLGQLDLLDLVERLQSTLDLRRFGGM